MDIRRANLTVLTLMGASLASCQPGSSSAETDHLAWRALAFISRPTAVAAGATNDDTRVSWRLWWNPADVYAPGGPTGHMVNASSFRRIACGPQSEMMLVYNRVTRPPRPCEAIWLGSASVAYILKNGLWQREQLIALAQAGRIQFPLDPSDPSKVPIELKTEWVRINGGQAAKYIVGVDNQDTPRGLVAFHMMIHTRPKWVWATFIHEDLKNLVTDSGETFQDAFGFPNGGASKDLLKLLASYHVGILEHYRLIGTQTDFDAPPVLGNPLIEDPGDIKAGKISCISCHSFAAIDSIGRTPTIVVTAGRPDVKPFFKSANFNFTLAVHAICAPGDANCSTGRPLQAP